MSAGELTLALAAGWITAERFEAAMRDLGYGDDVIAELVNRIEGERDNG